MKKIEIFTDGACRGNPGPGGWGAVLRYNNHEKYLKGAEPHTTNNRMEVSAAIFALESLKEKCNIELTSDSQYLKNGILQWIHNWKKNNWRTSNKQPVKNQDLWMQLDALVQQHDMTWHWVKGHSGHRENELCDSLANEAIDDMLNLKKADDVCDKSF